MVRRTVSFAEAVALGQVTVEDVTACLASSQTEIQAALARGHVPIAVDPDGTLLKNMQPTVLVEATLSKYNSGVTLEDAPIVIALGPGYEAGKDVHAVIETNRGHNLGRVYLQGCAEANTGVPGAIGGYTIERLLRAPATGVLYGVQQIGDFVKAGA
ncbi:MAG TPA: molybdenum hydroxylase, partial [Ktedonobacteraceae bacterium]|nr:molybdenum hydroxylase [Ktedonobacteraceae bacterium]